MSERTTELTTGILMGLLPDIVVNRGSVASGTDLNTCVVPGAYLIARTDIENCPPDVTYGSLVVLPGYYIMHIIVPTQKPWILIRLRTNPSTGSWTKWVKLEGVYL